MPSIDLALINDAAEDTVLAYARNPDIYDPNRSRLDVFISVAASRRVLNALRGERRRKEAERRAGSTMSLMEAGLLRERGDRSLLDLINKTSSPLERRFLAARMDGEKSTANLARTLGGGALPAADQRRLVKQAADRLRIRLRRHIFGAVRKSCQS
jgi:hypothetical protein